MTTVLSMHELAARWGISLCTLRRVLRSGGPRCFLVGSRRRFRLDDVEAFERGEREGDGVVLAWRKRC